MRLVLSLITLCALAASASADDRSMVPPAAARLADELIAAADAEDVPGFLALFQVKASGHGRAWAEDEIRSAKSIVLAFGLQRGDWIKARRRDAVIVYRDDRSAREVTVFELAETDGTWAVRDVYFTSGTASAPSPPEITSGLDDSKVIGGGLVGSSGPRSGPPPTKMRRAPNIKLGGATVSRGLDKAIVRRYLRRELSKISYCYEKTLVEARPPSGTMIITLAIQLDGAVASAKASGVRKDVDDCVRDVVTRIVFPRPKSVVNVRYPIAFR